MEDIVGIKFEDKKMGEGAFLTWGRLFDEVDESELLDLIKKHLPNWNINNLESIEVCYSLQEVSDQPYFYECLIKFIQEPIPYGAKYKAWKKKKKKALLEGKDIYFMGFMNNYLAYLERNKKNLKVKFFNKE